MPLLTFCNKSPFTRSACYHSTRKAALQQILWGAENDEGLMANDESIPKVEGKGD
jgi:hypothetical protein